jgi:DNA-binding transcriptional regulator YiaG
MKKKSIEARLIASAEQALAVKRGELRPTAAYDLPRTSRDASAEKAPSYTKEEIAGIRLALGLSQALFAEALNVSLGTVRSWEQGFRFPEGAASRLLQVAEKTPNALTIYVVDRPKGDATSDGATRKNALREVSRSVRPAGHRKRARGSSSHRGKRH